MKRYIKTALILSALAVIAAAFAGNVAAQGPNGDLYAYGQRGTIEADVYGGCVYFEGPYFAEEECYGRLAVTIKGVDPRQVYVEEYDFRGIRRYSVRGDTVRIVGTSFSGSVCGAGGFSISLSGSEYGFNTLGYGEATLTGRGDYCFNCPIFDGTSWSGQTLQFGGGLEP